MALVMQPVGCPSILSPLATYSYKSTCVILATVWSLQEQLDRVGSIPRSWTSGQVHSSPRCIGKRADTLDCFTVISRFRWLYITAMTTAKPGFQVGSRCKAAARIQARQWELDPAGIPVSPILVPTPFMELEYGILLASFEDS